MRYIGTQRTAADQIILNNEQRVYVIYNYIILCTSYATSLSHDINIIDELCCDNYERYKTAVVLLTYYYTTKV